MQPTDPATPTPTTPEDDAEQLVRTFLGALEARDLSAGSACLAPDAKLIFPGGAEYRELPALLSAAAARYQRIAKRIAAVERLDGGRTVYVRGTLHGLDRHGAPFDHVRFIDRYELVAGRIRRLEVWNDLAESGVLQRRG